MGWGTRWRCDQAVGGGLHLFLTLTFSLISDLTTLTSAAYQQSLTVHTGAHLLSMQGEG